MLNFCDFIQIYVLTTNHHIKENISSVSILKKNYTLNILLADYACVFSVWVISMDGLYDKQRLPSDCIYVRSDQNLCLSPIPRS